MRKAPPKAPPAPPASFRRLCATLKLPTEKEQKVIEATLLEAVELYEKHGR